MKVTAPSLAALSQLSQLVGKQGLTAEIQSSHARRRRRRGAHAGARRSREGAPMNELAAKLKAWYSGLQEREQRVVAIGSVALGAVILVGGILLPLQSAVSDAVKRAETRREDLAWMRVNAPEIQYGAAPLFNDTGEAPVVVVDRVGREAGLGSALRGTQPSGNGVRVQLEAAPFDTLITWLATLDQRYGFAIDSITVDRAARPGVVNANITFAAPRR